MLSRNLGIAAILVTIVLVFVLCHSPKCIILFLELIAVISGQSSANKEEYQFQSIFWDYAPAGNIYSLYKPPLYIISARGLKYSCTRLWLPLSMSLVEFFRLQRYSCCTLGRAEVCPGARCNDKINLHSLKQNATDKRGAESK